MSYAEVKPDFAKQCQCKPNAERGKLACMSYAEVKPDFAEGNGISAQGKAGRRTATPWVPPQCPGFKKYRAL